MTAAQEEAAGRLRESGAARGVVELVAATPLAGRGGVDSARTDDREVLRACVSALAYLARQLPPPGPPSAPTRPWWRRSPAPGPFLEAPFDELVEAWWQRRVREGAATRWRRVWDVMHARDDVPWSALAHQPRAGVAADPVGTDLLRRVNGALATSPPEVRVGAGRLVRHHPADPLGVPAVHLTWAVSAAQERGVVVPSSDPGRTRRVPVEVTLARAIEELSRHG